MDKDASKVPAMVTNIASDTASLRERWASDFRTFRQAEKFKIPAREGEWDSYTSNRASAEANRVVNTLADSERRIWSPVENKKKSVRAKISATEKLIIGCINIVDRRNIMIPQAVPLQDALSWTGTHRGFLVGRCYLGDGPNGTARPVIDAFDPLNCFWIGGGDGTIWFCHRRFASYADINAQYPEFVTEHPEMVKENDRRQIAVYDVSDNEEMGVVIGTEWARYPKLHRLDHNPVAVIPVGSTPLIQDGENDDAYVSQGESIFVNNRLLYELDSRIKSYILTLVGRATKRDTLVYYDSRLSGGGLPPELGKMVAKGNITYVDTGKGQKIEEGIAPEMTQDAYRLHQLLAGDLSMGGMAPISFGQIEQQLPAQGINLLADLSLNNIKPIKQAIERMFVWYGREICLQYKNGNFKGKLKVSGYDDKENYFKAEISPGDIQDDLELKCDIVPNLPYDEQQLMAIAQTGLQTGMWSMQTARERSRTIADPDGEQQIQDREQADNMMMLNLLDAERAYLKDGDFEKALFVREERNMRRAMQMQQMNTTGGSMPGSKPGMAPQEGIPVQPPVGAPQGAMAARPGTRQKFMDFMRNRGRQ